MRITLIQPPQGARLGLAKVLLVEPLGLECVSAALKLHAHDVRLVDLRLDGTSELWSELRSFHPGAVGISCGFTTDVYSSLETARSVKRALPDAFVFAGGHHASLIPGDLLFPGSPVDAVVVGEGEETGAALAAALECKDDPGDVPGVMTLANRALGFRRRALVDSLDRLPLPDRDVSRRYRRRYHHGFMTPSACVETSRGCPFNCNFCSIWVFYQRRARRRSAERVLEDLARVSELGERNVFFTDDLAFLERDVYERLADHIRRAGLRLHYSCETRADLVVKHRSLFEEWSELGMNTVFLGIEKIDDAGLEAVRKRTRGGAATNLEAVEILRGCGITPMTSFITDPSWGEADFDRLERFVRTTRLPNSTFTILTPVPGTELWERAKARVTTSDYAYFDAAHLVLPAALPPERFYERFARLYRLVDARVRLGFAGAWTLATMMAHGRSWVVGRLYRAVRELRAAQTYLAYPGAVRKPDFLPPDFGAATWVDRSRSPLAFRSLQAARRAG